EGIVATVNDEPITISDVRERARLLLIGFQAQPSQEIIEQLTGQALEQLIDEKLQLQEAREYDLIVSERDIQNAVNQIANEQGTDRNTLYQSLLQSGINPDSLEDQQEAEIAWRRIMSGLYGQRIRISANQIDDQLNRILEGATKTQYRLSEIFLFEPNPQARGQVLAAARGLIDQLQQGARFEAAAQQISSAPTAAAGGDMGWVSLSDLDPELASAVRNAPGPGLIGPIEVANGAYVLLLRSRRDPQEKRQLVELRQINTKDETRNALNAALRNIESCDEIADEVEDDDRLTDVFLGRVAIDGLSEKTRGLIEGVSEDGHSEVFDSRAGPAVLFVCERAEETEDLPSRSQIENSLFQQELGMVSDRALRNLRREAAIIRR
ncbi:MAG: SurA N-terminal domain-containing protein, partial [Pseudomonadota bacterium]